MKIVVAHYVLIVCNIGCVSSDYSLVSTASNKTLYKSYANDPFGSSIKTKQRSFGGDKIPMGNKSEEDEDEEKERSKRHVLNLYNMISCATGCNPLIYKGYGCFCGFLGSGRAVDGIDRCCKIHDWCYNTANCPYYLEYFIPYYWTCLNAIPYCSINHGAFGAFNSCSYKLCECDRNLANCLRRHRCPRHRAICNTSPWRYVQNVLMNF